MLYFIGNYSYPGLENGTIEECYLYCNEKKVIGIDIESSRLHPKGLYDESHYKPGLDPYMSKVCMLQIGDIENQYVIDVRCTDISILLPLFANKNILFVIHNALFESRHLKHNYNIIFYNIYDTYLVEQTLTNGLQYNKKENPTGLRYTLEALAGRYLDIESSKDIDLFNQLDDEEEYVDKSIRIQFVEWGDKPFTEKQIRYGADDIIYPLRIRELQLKNKWYSQELVDLENSFCLVLGDIMLKGIGFNPEQWLKVYRSKVPIFEERIKMLNEYVILNYPKFCKSPDLFDPVVKCNILWSSSDQVIKLFKTIGFCPKERSKQTKKTEYTVGAKSLFKLLTAPYKEKYMKNESIDSINSNEDLVLAYLLMKRSEQQITTFGKDFLKYIHPITKRIHTNYQQIQNTGRISSYKINLQNLPADEDYRASFIATLECKMVCADYSAQESRIVADISEDENLLDLFNNGHPIFGDDVHSLVATKMYSLMRNDPTLIIQKDTHPKERYEAKTISFKVLYGCSSYTLKDDLGVEEEIAQEFIDNYFAAFPGVKIFIEKAQIQVAKNGFIIIDPYTNRVWFDKDFTRLEVKKKEILSLYPEGYGKLNKEAKDIAKKQLYLKYPQIPEFWTEYFTIKGKLERNAGNYPVQGLAASMTKKAGILFRKWQLENNMQDTIYLVNLIHDEITAETKDESNYKIIQECMEKGGNMFTKHVKMKAEAALSDFWKK